MSWNSCQWLRKSPFVATFVFALVSFSPFETVLAQAPEPASNPVALTSSPLTDPAIERRVEALLKQMTLDEKVGQLAHYSSAAPTGPRAGSADYPRLIARGEVGSLFNLDSEPAPNQY